MRLRRLLAELKRRRVYRVAAGYAVACFAVLEAADLVLPALGAPPWILRALVWLALAGFPVVLVVSWAFQVTPEGLRLDDSGESAEAPTAGSPRPAFRFWVMTALVGAVGIAAWLAGRRSAAPPPAPSSSALVVLPFSPAVRDSSLQRLGRELVVTLSSTLSATADLQVAEPLSVLATVGPDEGALELARARQVAKTLGAGRLVHGGLVRVDDGIRLDLGLYESETLRQLGAAGVVADRADALTDSAAVEVLRLIWDETSIGPPSPGAISTGSPQALQAYLAGERAIADGRWREAPEAFARAVRADSTFWFAYWRLQYALEYHGSPVDSVVRARAWEHRHELPDRDRLLIEADRADRIERLAILRDATRRFPSYWMAWWRLADQLVHHGGFLGYTLSESRAALERTLELNPRFVSAWSHLFWVASRQRNLAEMRRVVAELSGARYDRTSLLEAGINSLALYDAQVAVVEAGRAVPERVVETGVRELTGFRGPMEPERLSSSLLQQGFVEAQIELSRAVASHPDSRPPLARAQQLVLAHALAAREAWDSALVAADAYAASASRPEDLVLPYQIAAVGAWADRIPPAEAERRRTRLEDLVRDGGALSVEITWLDGLLAFRRGDVPGIERASRRIGETGAPSAGPLQRSLDGLRAGLAAGPGEGGRALQRLERELVDSDRHLSIGYAHPFSSGIHRLTAARWLVQAGDTAGARRLLPWHEAVLPGPLYRMSIASQVLSTPALRLRAHLARDAGRDGEASHLESLYLWRMSGAASTASAPR